MEIGLNAHRVNQSIYKVFNCGYSKEYSRFSFCSWKMLKDKGVPLWIIMEMLNKFRADKEKTPSQTNNDSPADAINTTEITNETRLDVVL